LSRILTALVGLPLLFAVMKYFPPSVFLVLVIVSVVLGAYELFEIARRKGYRPHRLLGAALAVAVAYSFFDERLPTVDILAASTLLIPLASIGRALKEKATLDAELSAVSITLFGVLFTGLLMGYSLAILGPGDEQGRDLIVLLFLVVWICDAGAFTVGSLWGRTKLLPVVSPAKTLEGALGGLFFAVVAALVASQWFFTRLGLRHAIVLGLLLGIFGILGDLAESLMKRSAAVKDSGWLFPGHGGMLDRTDSILFAAPVLFYYHKLFMV